MPKAAQQVEWITREDTLAQLGMKDRRLRDYIAAGKIRQQEGRLHAGDVARLQTERDGKKSDAQVRALATIDPQMRKATKLAETRALLQAGAAAGKNELQLGNEAVAASPHARAWLTLAEAEDYTGLPEMFLLALIDGGKLPACNVGVRAGGRYRVKRSDLDAIAGDLLG